MLRGTSFGLLRQLRGGGQHKLKRTLQRLGRFFGPRSRVYVQIQKLQASRFPSFWAQAAKRYMDSPLAFNHIYRTCHSTASNQLKKERHRSHLKKRLVWKLTLLRSPPQKKKHCFVHFAPSSMDQNIFLLWCVLKLNCNIILLPLNYFIIFNLFLTHLNVNCCMYIWYHYLFMTYI
jgi:hypothetical protein